MPCAMARAWPLVPPPCTWTLTSNFRCVLVTRSGANAASSSTRRPRNASASFSLISTRPSPGWMRTRATAFFRRPVPRLKISAKLDVSLGVEGDHLRLLGLVPMLGPGVDAKSGEHVRAQRVVLQHSLHRVHQREGWVQLLGLLEGACAQAAGVSRVSGVLLAGELRAADFRLRSVDDDDVIASVQVRRERGLVLASKDLGDRASKAAEDLVGCVNNKPIALQIRRFCRPGLLLAQSRSFSKSLPPVSGPPRARFGPPGAGREPSAPRQPTREVCGRVLRRPAHQRCCAPGREESPPPPAPARRSPLAAPPWLNASRARVPRAARRPSSSWSNRAYPPAHSPPPTSRRRPGALRYASSGPA